MMSEFALALAVLTSVLQYPVGKFSVQQEESRSNADNKIAAGLLAMIWGLLNALCLLAFAECDIRRIARMTIPDGWDRAAAHAAAASLVSHPLVFATALVIAFFLPALMIVATAMLDVASRHKHLQPQEPSAA